MIDLHTWTTPNGRKISIMLEECALPYSVKLVNIGKGEQFAPEFLAVSPNNKIPAIVDHEGPDGAPISVFESGAILIYLAEKTGKFYGNSARDKNVVREWLFFQVGGVGPMFGQLNHFALFAKEKVPYAIERYRAETLRLLGVMNKRLEGSAFLAGAYSIADMATYPWALSALSIVGKEAESLTHFQRWMQEVGARPAVQAGMAVPKVS